MIEPRIGPLGDSAVVIELGRTIDPLVNARVHALDAAVTAAALTGVSETVPTYRSLLVHYDPLAAGYEEVANALAAVTADSLARPFDARTPDAPAVEIPVSYGGVDGPDLEDVARHARLDPGEVIRRHSAVSYTVAMLGFAPGFPYLMGMDPSLACPRHSSPRIRVPAGSVAIADAQTGIYPYAMPGGWRLIGRTTIPLFDPGRDPPAALLPGAQVRFVPAPRSTSGLTFDRGPFRARPSPNPRGDVSAIRVIEPGFLTTVQDGGRSGFQRFGVPPSGAADRLGLAAGNRALANPPGAAALEITAGGFEVELLAPLDFAISGAETGATLGGRAIVPGSRRHAVPGDRLRVDRPDRGWRTYLCVAGGIDVTPVLGSRSTYLPAGFGGLEGRALRAGDMLRSGSREILGGTLTEVPRERRMANGGRVAREGSTLALPFIPGGQWDEVPEDARRAFLGRRWTVSHQSDRIGLRLEGEPVHPERDAPTFVSDGTVTGTIQLTGEGRPIVLLVDRQTTGGYPKLGAVASVAHHLLGQLRAEDTVTFESISVGEAQSEWRTLQVRRG